MTEDKSEPKISVTPLKRASKFQKKKNEKLNTIVDEQKFKAYDVTFNGREISLLYNRESGEIVIEGKLYAPQVEDYGRIVKTHVEKDHTYTIEYHEGQIFLEGRLIDFDFHEAIPKLNRQKSILSSKEIVNAPLPGQVINIYVSIGDVVKPGDKIVTMEAMKMQNDILCSVRGLVKEIYVNEGDQVGTGQKLVLIKTDV